MPRSFPHLPVAALIAAWAVLAIGSAQAQAPAQPVGKISGRILGAKQGESVKGAKVVLVRFTLDPQGTPQGAPIQMKDADDNGAYVFENVPIDAHSVYQLGTRVGGSLIPSESFTFPDGQRMVTLNLRVPEVVADSTSVRIISALVALEPQVGGVWVTDVVHVENPTQNTIEGVQSPLELNVPPEAQNLEMIRQDQPQGSHQRVGDKLLVYGNLKPGISTVAVRYRVPVWFGVLKVEKRYPRPVTDMVVLAPAGTLRVASDRLDSRQRQTIEGQSYDTWGGANLAPRTAVRVTATGVPIKQLWLLTPFALFLVIMAGVITWYIRRRIPAAPDSLRA